MKTLISFLSVAATCLLTVDAIQNCPCQEYDGFCDKDYLIFAEVTSLTETYDRHIDGVAVTNRTYGLNILKIYGGFDDNQLARNVIQAKGPDYWCNVYGVEVGLKYLFGGQFVTDATTGEGTVLGLNSCNFISKWDDVRLTDELVRYRMGREGCADKYTVK